ncbi:methylated-DNA-[protein]-cysteine S-methyltransferase [Halomonas ventosae]|uniref:Methylated-DNA--protein-cysteine methyltransferase n=1 Tax=Halomonas ventosae TaxID=229007 RepID=A0A4R6ZLJ0_9GAMM|nr:methylated-DNA--[protein]-cysteine S-methyltransferase [Halomonas ventosae]TDR53301.1 methylated-DNA-[protein]-cysteine S-methyltransferase [Halomonas ventosae]
MSRDVSTDHYLDHYHPPGSDALGLVRIHASATGITGIEFVERADVPARPNALTERAREQLADYFAGARHDFDLPLSPTGTDFQQRVWAALATIPFGETRNYAEIAEQLRCKGGQRAVGAANGKNPIAIVVPCHRVIGSDGRLTGYAGGIGRKQWLLAHEAGEVPMGLL